MRSAFDKLISGAGLVLAAVLLIGGGLLTWANVSTRTTIVLSTPYENRPTH